MSPEANYCFDEQDLNESSTSLARDGVQSMTWIDYIAHLQS